MEYPIRSIRITPTRPLLQHIPLRLLIHNKICQQLHSHTTIIGTIVENQTVIIHMSANAQRVGRSIAPTSLTINKGLNSRKLMTPNK